MSTAFDLAKTRFNIQQRGIQPAMFLIGIFPMADLGVAFFNQRIQLRLQTVRCFKTDAQYRKHPKTMKR